ncbi:MAG: hypothetical protein J6J23_03330 [Clostridia bacterium]|nr:hypothetical protein [Clostridia bacterium]
MEEILTIEQEQGDGVMEKTPITDFMYDKNILGDHNINYIVLAVNYDKFNIGKPTYEIKLMGRPMLDWVKSACAESPKVKKVEDDVDIIQEVKELLDDSEWTIVLFSDTPLLTNDTIEKSFAFAEGNGLNVCKLKRGYIFKTEYVKRIEGIYGIENCNINTDEFMIVNDFIQLSKATTILKNRIIDFHLRNGVVVLDRNSTYIDAEVSIGNGTFIYPGNYIYGSSELGDNVQLYSNNRILSSIIANNAKIENSTISSSVIGERCKIKNSNIGNDTLIKANTKVLDGSNIKESIIDEECKVMNATVKGALIEKNSKIYDGARVIGKDGNITIKNNVTIGENCIINVPCVVQEGKKLLSGVIVNK